MKGTIPPVSSIDAYGPRFSQKPKLPEQPAVRRCQCGWEHFGTERAFLKEFNEHRKTCVLYTSGAGRPCNCS
jgi:hypothetical protein